MSSTLLRIILHSLIGQNSLEIMIGLDQIDLICVSRQRVVVGLQVILALILLEKLHALVSIIVKIERTLPA